MKNTITDASIGRLMKDAASGVTSEKLKEADHITVFAGISDYSLSTLLGTIEDDEIVNTFYGSVHKTISTLLKAKLNPS
jgi:hypothetical protein